MGSLSRDFCPGGSLFGCLCPGVSVQWGMSGDFCTGVLCPRDIYPGVSVHGISFQEGLYLGSLCPEGFLSRVGSLSWWSLSSGVCSWGLSAGGFLSRRVSIWGSLSRVSVHRVFI